MKRILFLVPLLLAFAVCAEAFAGKIAPLIDPAKLATLGKRGANSRVQKCVYWLEEARKAGESPEKVAQAAVAKGHTKEAAKLTTSTTTAPSGNIFPTGTKTSPLACLSIAGQL